MLERLTFQLICFNDKLFYQKLIIKFFFIKELIVTYSNIFPLVEMCLVILYSLKNVLRFAFFLVESYNLIYS